MTDLLDTNAWIHFLEDSAAISDSTASLIESPDTRCVVSIASVWEAAIKVGLGKLRLPYSQKIELARLFDDCGFAILLVEFADAAAIQHLQRHHGDPFDLLMVAQAQRISSPSSAQIRPLTPMASNASGKKMLERIIDETNSPEPTPYEMAP